MSDSLDELKQEIALETAQLQQHQAELQRLAKHETTVWLRHPLTGDVQEVRATPEQLVPWMGRGYQQFTPAAPVNTGEE